MMKKLTALVMLLVMALCCCTAQADGTMQKFQPYTTVKMDVLEKYGFTTSSYDDFAFTAELSPENHSISYTVDLYKDTFSIIMDLKVVYSETGTIVAPRLIFQKSGSVTYSSSKMENIYIRIGENRYKVDVSDCSRSSSNKATDTAVEVLRDVGVMMLKDIVNSDDEIHVNFDVSQFWDFSDITLTSEDRETLKNFYNACEEAGVFDQEALYATQDDYYIITRFNK